MFGKASSLDLTSSKGRTTSYKHLQIIDTEGKLRNILLTEREYESAISRGEKNDESIEKQGLISKILSAIARLLS